MIRTRQNRQSEANAKHTAENRPNVSLKLRDKRMPKKKTADKGILTSFFIRLIIGLSIGGANV